MPGEAVAKGVGPISEPQPHIHQPRHLFFKFKEKRKAKKTPKPGFSLWPGGDILAHFPGSKVSTGRIGFSRNPRVEIFS